MNKLMQQLAAQGFGDATPHGWRTTATGWVKERALTMLDEKAMDIALDDAVDTQVGAAYNDRTLIGQRRLLAERYIYYLRDETYPGAYSAYPEHDRSLRPWAYTEKGQGQHAAALGHGVQDPILRGIA